MDCLVVNWQQNHHHWLILAPMVALPGDNVKIISQTDWRRNVTGIDNNQLPDLWIVTVGGVGSSGKDEMRVIMHQYAYNSWNQTISSSIKMKHLGIHVDACFFVCGGHQTLYTHDDYILYLSFQNGLPYLAI